MAPIDVSTPDGQVVCVLLAEDRLSHRGRLAAFVLALAVLALLGLGSTWAGVPPVITAQAPGGAAGSEQALPVGCDGSTTHLAWNSATYPSVELSLLGDRVASPGDRVWCTVSVTNTGPTVAVMTVAFAPVRIAVHAANPDLASGLFFFWDVAGVGGSERFDTAMGLGTDDVVAEVPVAYGQTVPIEVGFTMPDVVTDYQSDGDSTQLAFEVTVQLRESTGNSPHGPGTSTPPTGPGPSTPTPTGLGPSSTLTGAGTDTSREGPADRGKGSRIVRLPRTGAEVAATAAVAGVVLLAGTVVWVVARRRTDPAQRRDQQGPAAPSVRSGVT